MNDLTKDTENVIDYLTYGKNGMIPTRLLPIKHIITALKEAATQLTMGLHFPFKIQTEHWQTIHTYITFSAYSDGPYIYTILRFPVVAYPTFKLVKAIPLPVHDHANVFAYIKINHPLIAIDKENHHYKLLEEVELERCIRETNTYTCEQNFATYYAETTAPCEVQIYTHTPGQLKYCEKNHMISNTPLWIALTEEQAWLYSTAHKQEISIKCEKQIEEKIILEETGKIKLKDNCKLITPNVILKARKIEGIKYIQNYLPEYNITLEIKNKDTDKNKLAKTDTLRQIIKNPVDLTKLSISLEEIRETLEDNDYNLLKNKYTVYSMGTCVVIITIIELIMAHKQKQK
ncbi:hypothetical protein P5V15_001360 [Pogonomyrmex californicus]